MPAVINTNLASLFAQQSLGASQNSLATSVQRLSSGLRINSAKDDAAGLSVAQNMQSQLNAVNMSARNIGDATNMLATSDSSLGYIQDMLLRMKTLSVEGKNDSLSTTQRGNIYSEISELNKEINSVAKRTTFNGNALLTSTGVSSNATGTLQPGLAGAAAVGFGVNSAVSSISLTNVVAGTYTLSAAGANITLTRTNGPAQTITGNADRTQGNYSYNFSDFGIKINVLQTGNTSQADTVTALTTGAAETLIITNAGAEEMKFQSGAASDDLFRVQTLNVQTDNNALAGSTGATFWTKLEQLRTAGTTAAYNTAFDELNTATDALVDDINTKRATLGSQMNRVSYISSQLASQSGNIQQSKSAILDTDFAAETARLTKGQIMQQAATAMLAQANQMPNVILSLLK